RAETDSRQDVLGGDERQGARCRLLDAAMRVVEEEFEACAELRPEVLADADLDHVSVVRAYGFGQFERDGLSVREAAGTVGVLVDPWRVDGDRSKGAIERRAAGL